MCLVFLMKEKSEIQFIIPQFYKMVEIQFQSQIQILRTNNGREYLCSVLDNFLKEKGIVHQSSCTYTPQQNGIAERKNRHLLETARALLFTHNLPKTFWGEAVLTSAYLINKLPSRILEFQTPINRLMTIFPHNRLINSLSLRVLPLFTILVLIVAKLILELLSVFS